MDDPPDSDSIESPGDDNEEPDLFDFEERRTNMLAHYHVNNVTTLSPMLVEGVPLDRLVAAGESDRNVGKGLADGGAGTSVVGAGWKLLHKTQC